MRTGANQYSSESRYSPKRVGSTATWTTTVEGAYRGCNFLATGLATDRVPEDDIIVVAIHFTKDNGELSSVTLDENSKIEAIST